MTTKRNQKLVNAGQRNVLNQGCVLAVNLITYASSMTVALLVRKEENFPKNARVIPNAILGRVMKLRRHVHARNQRIAMVAIIRMCLVFESSIMGLKHLECALFERAQRKKGQREVEI